MIRKSAMILVCAALLAPSVAWAQDAKAFLGDWVLTIEGRRGPQERPLNIKDTAGKLSAGKSLLNPANMQMNHPLGVPQPPVVAGFTTFKTVAPGSAVNYDANGNVQCDSCHNPHDNAFGKFLKVNPAGGAICLTCHNV